jgi:hypothetical protein
MVIRKRETFEPVTTCAAMAAANVAGRSSLTGKGRGRSSRFASRTGVVKRIVRYGEIHLASGRGL